MNINELRKQSYSARARRTATLDAEFNSSPLKEYIDRRIKEAAANGKIELSLNFYYTKKQVFGDEYDGPTLDTVIRNYQNEGFVAYSKNWLSPNGYGNTAIVISWK